MTEIVHYPIATSSQSSYCAYNDQGKLIGHVDYLRSSDAVTIVYIRVHSDYRRQGIATALLERVYEDNPGVRMQSCCIGDDAAALYYGLLMRDPRAANVCVSAGHVVGTGFM